MDWIASVIAWGQSAWNKITGIASDIPGALTDLWRMIQQATAGIRYVFTHPFTSMLNIFAILAALFTGNESAMINAMVRLVGWYDVNRTIPLRNQVLLWFAQLRARIAYLFAMAYLYINLLYRKSLAYTRQQVAIEHKAMLNAFAAAESYTRKLVSALHSAIEKETASGYSSTLRERTTIVNRIADLIATRNPAMRAVVSDIIRIVLDLLAVDDPLARLLAGFLIREVVNRLGIDKAAGVLLADIAGPLLADPRPKGLHDVISNIGLRLDALESQWAGFMEDGGPQILQAGREWKNITSILADAGMLAFFGGMVTAPQATAAETAAVLGGLIHDSAVAVTALLD